MKKVAVRKRLAFLCKSFLFVLIMCGGARALPVSAAINQQIDFYGTLQNESGVNLTGTYDIVFRYYDAPSGGTLLGTDTHTVANGNAVDVRNGKFAVVLGSGTGNSLAGIDFNSPTIYVGLTIGSDSEMVPRERLAAAPYAFNADELDGYQATDLLRYNASGSMTASTNDTLLTLRQDGIGKILALFGGASEVVTVLSNGQVGIGTTTPTQDFVVNGNMSLTGGLYDASSSVGTNGYVLQSDGTKLHWVATSTLGITGGGGSSLFTDGGATTYLTDTTDNLAIGTTTSTARLAVVGDIDLASDNAGISLNGVRYFSGSTTLQNIQVGERAGLNFTDETTDNIAIGFEAGMNASTSFVTDNVLIGRQAGSNIDFGESNSVLIGNMAGMNAGGGSHVAIGMGAGYSSLGSNSVLLGYYAGAYNNGGSVNAIGSNAAYYNTGSWNNIIGALSAFNNSGSDNNIIGREAGWNNIGDRNNMFGYKEGTNNTGNDNNIIGQFAGIANAGDFNTMIGSHAGATNTGWWNNIIGTDAGLLNTGGWNNLMGYQAGYSNTGDYNTQIGMYAGNSNTGSYNNIIGFNAGYINPGDNNNIIGNYAGWHNTGAENNLIGHYAGQNNTGNNNNLIGQLAGYSNTGDYNEFIGNQAGYLLQSTSSVAIGAFALYGGLSEYQAINNVAIGYQAGNQARTGADNNVFVGYRAGYNVTTGKNNIVLGYDLSLKSATQSNTMTIGNLLYATGLTATGTATSTGKFGIGTSSPTAQLTTVGTVRFAAFGAGALQTDASGNVSVSSDERLKDIQGEFTKGLEVIAAINPIQYKWKVSTGYDTANVYTGFSAQNVQSVLPEAVGKSPDGYLSLSDRPILATVINAIKEIYAWMNITDTRVTTLEAQVQSMQAEIDTLKTGQTTTQQSSGSTGGTSSDTTSSGATDTHTATTSATSTTDTIISPITSPETASSTLSSDSMSGSSDTAIPLVDMATSS
jgi:trimeric autotransporter adhesin